jgi:crotonobetainyl-CoA:carnitine CoA-transferase CaiB-like acyl-CoA transferase
MGNALDGVRVLDLSRVMSGPFASTMLADLGADVVKVEAAGAGDIMRHMGGHARGGMNAVFLGLNRGKRSLAVDFRDPDAIELVRELASEADVFLENFRPGVCDAMRLGSDDLLAANPRLVYVSISGFGPDSPSAQEPAYDTMLQGRSGMVARQKRGRRGEPDLVRSYIVDKVAGFFAVQAVLAALLERTTSGTGQYVSVPMMDASLYYQWADGFTDLAFVGDGVRPGTIFPLSASLTQVADGYVTHLAMSDKERAGVARAVGRPDLNDDPRFASTSEWTKPENMREYYQAVSDGFRSLPTTVALDRLHAEGVPCAPIAEPAEVLADPHVVETGVIEEWEHERVGRVRQVRYPVRSANDVAPMARTAPALGEHSREVLEELGIAASRIDDLIARGAVGVARSRDERGSGGSRPVR